MIPLVFYNSIPTYQDLFIVTLPNVTDENNAVLFN